MAAATYAEWLTAVAAAKAIRGILSFSARMKFDAELRPILDSGCRIAYPDALYHITAEDVRRAEVAAKDRPMPESMTTLERITAILERARVAGGWDDEAVARAVLAGIREPTAAMKDAVHHSDAYSPERCWHAMIDAARNEKPELGLDDDGNPIDRAPTSPNLGHG
jgi:hypothetical protein